MSKPVITVENRSNAYRIWRFTDPGVCRYNKLNRSNSSNGEFTTMAERATITLQQGIWIDKERLAGAGLQDSLEITVQPGEIRIRAAEPREPRGPDGTRDVERAYPLIDESFREGWEAPGMQDYDRYEELKKT